MTIITYNGQPLQATQIKIDINRYVDQATLLEDVYLTPLDIDTTIKISNDTLDLLGKIIPRRKIIFNCTKDMMNSLRILQPKSSIIFEVGSYKIPCVITRRDYKRNKLYLLEAI